ncbi:hypothetical protein Tco_1477724, partial [Tanacetum coccineum]
DKRKLTKTKILDVLEERIEKAGKHFNKAKEKMDVNNGREKMLMETDTSYDHNPFQVTYAERSDHNPFQATFDESSDHNPFQATSDESSDCNPFQATSDDTLKSSFEDTCSSDSTWEQKKILMVNKGQAMQKQKKLPFHQGFIVV